MSNRTLAVGLIILGLLIVIADFVSGPLGLASTSFGTKHIIALVVGLVVLVVGVVMAVTRKAA